MTCHRKRLFIQRESGQDGVSRYNMLLDESLRSRRWIWNCVWTPLADVIPGWSLTLADIGSSLYRALASRQTNKTYRTSSIHLMRKFRCQTARLMAQDDEHSSADHEKQHHTSRPALGDIWRSAKACMNTFTSLPMLFGPTVWHWKPLSCSSLCTFGCSTSQPPSLG